MQRLLARLLPAALLSGAAVLAHAQDAALVEQGRQIYLHGRLPGGAPLVGHRAQQEPVSASAAACVNCHRASGLGSVEGNVAIPPITGQALFSSTQAVVVRQDRRFDPGLSIQRPAYTPASFAAALREGLASSGRRLDALMPRFALDDAALRALQAYLDTLSAQWSPGAHADGVQVATVIAPGMQPARREAFVQTLGVLLQQMNGNLVSGQRQKISAIERHMSGRRRLALQVWELSGPSSSWEQQLQQYQARSPVFAILSGLGGSEWQPVQDFCDRSQVVCWFPSVDLIPANADRSTFSLYLSGGVRTEARVMAQQIAQQARQAPLRVLQLVGASPLARGAASALREALPAGMPVRDWQMDWPTPAQPMPAPQAGEVVVAWLDAQELPLLHQLPASPSNLLVSARLAGLDADALQALLPAAAASVQLVQTLELPAIRQANLMRFDAWQQGSKVALVDRQMQSEVYFAARALVYTLRGMLDNLYTPYLVERAESTLSMFEAMQVQDEVQSLMMAPVNKAPQLAAAVPASGRDRSYLQELLQRGGTTMYPRLSLAPGQRIASKGAYVQPLRSPDTPQLGEPVWLTP